MLRGWGVRDSNWDFSTELQHQLLTGLSITGGYYRNTGGYNRNTDSKNRVTDNVLVIPEDYDHYCITAPRHPQLPQGGGYQVCGLYNIKPGKFGLSENVVVHTSNFGKSPKVNDFFNVTLDARLRRGIRVAGGFDTGRSVEDTCFVIDSPQRMLNCLDITPFKAQTQVKLNGSVPLPGDIVVAATYQNISGPSYTASYPATSEEIAPSLGRPLSGGTRTASVPLLEPNTYYEDRIQRLDLRVSKIIHIRRVRVQLNLDSYNALNSDAIRSVNSTFDVRWRQANSIIDPRHVQIGGQISF